MIVYGIEMLPLTIKIKTAVSDCMQPWYADDAGTGGNFEDIDEFFELLQLWGPATGYFPDPTKSILVVKPHSVERVTDRFIHMGFQVTTGARYLGKYVGDTTDQAKYVDAKVTEWTDGIYRLSTFARSSPQCTFIALQKSYQKEWMHLQRVVDGISSHFAPVEAALCTRLLLSLLGGTNPTTIPQNFDPSSLSPSNHLV